MGLTNVFIIQDVAALQHVTGTVLFDSYGIKVFFWIIKTDRWKKLDGIIAVYKYTERVGNYLTVTTIVLLQ